MPKSAKNQLDLKRVAQPTPAERAIGQIRAWIESGELAPGKRLPSERVLSEQLGIGRTMLRAALATLEREGLIQTQARRARIVRGSASRAQSAVLGNAVVVLVERKPDRGVSARVEPGWHDFILRGASDGILERGLSALVMAGSSLDAAQVREVVGSGPRGVVAISGMTDPAVRERLLSALGAENIPLVAYGDLHDWPGCDVVMSDHRTGCRELTSWLLSRGCRRILRCWDSGPPDRRWLVERDAGYEEACAEAGVEPLPPLRLPAMPDGLYDREHFEVDAHTKAGYLSAHLTGAAPVDALLAVSDGLVPKLATACRILGKDPERDVTIVGYDNYWREAPERAHDPTAPRATVDKDNRRIGHALVDVLFERISGKLGRAAHRRVVRPRLVTFDDAERPMRSTKSDRGTP
jgi:DNA-binding LacI/PurR family transcriptional regulator